MLMPIRMTNVTITRSAGMNLAVTCPTCGEVFDAAPGESVSIDTAGGRLQVRQLLRAAKDLRKVAATASADEIEAMRSALALPGTPPENLPGPFRTWAKEHPEAVLILLDKFVDLLIALLVFWAGHSIGTPDPQPILIENLNITVDHQPTDAELVQIITRAIEATRPAEEPATPSPNTPRPEGKQP